MDALNPPQGRKIFIVRLISRILRLTARCVHFQNERSAIELKTIRNGLCFSISSYLVTTVRRGESCVTSSMRHASLKAIRGSNSPLAAIVGRS